MLPAEPKNPGAPSSSTPTPPSGMSARDRAVARLIGNSPNAPSPVANQNAVSPEEMGALNTSPDGRSDSSVEDAPEVELSSSPEATEKAPEAEEQPLSKQYAIIARKEKALRGKMQELKAKELDLSSRENALKSQPSASIDESKYISMEKLQADPISTLLRAGLSYDQLTQMVLNQPQIDPGTKMMMDEMRAEIRKLNEAQENSQKKAQDQQSNAYKQAVAQIRTEAKSLVWTDPAYETIKETDSVGDVVQLIEDTFKADGILLSVEDAAREVEEYLVEQAAKLAKLKKIQQRLAPPKQEAPKQNSPQQPQQMKTLTNSVGTARQLSARERAILAFKGELK